jgi:ferredoxin
MAKKCDRRGWSAGQTSASGPTPGAGGMTAERPLRVRVDQERCQGHARCAALASELFALDEFGNAREVGDGTVPPELEDKAWLAEANCPELAIEILKV